MFKEKNPNQYGPRALWKIFKIEILSHAFQLYHYCNFKNLSKKDQSFFKYKMSGSCH